MGTSSRATPRHAPATRHRHLRGCCHGHADGVLPRPVHPCRRGSSPNAPPAPTRPPRTLHMALHRWAVSRSRPTVVLPRAITTLRPGATTTPSLQTSRFTIRVCSTKPSQTHNHPSILQLLNLYLQTKRLELLSQWFCYKNTSVSVINTHKSHEGQK